MINNSPQSSMRDVLGRPPLHGYYNGAGAKNVQAKDATDHKSSITTTANPLRALHEDVEAALSCVEGVSACCGELPSKGSASFWSSAQNRYLLSNIVYVCYAFIIVWVDQVAQPYADDRWINGTPEEYDTAFKAVNHLYIVAAIIHVINAFMYAWSWLPLGYTWFSYIQIPEYMNVIGAALYLRSALLYPDQDGTYLDEVTSMIHRTETASASIELCAAVGWCITWWLTFPRKTKGRGWTLDDPDVWGLIFIVVPSMYYVAYNAQVLADPVSYCCNQLYITGNNLYAAGSIFYLIAALRDDGWFYALPAGGQCYKGCDSLTPLDPYGNNNEYGQQSTSALPTSCLGFPAPCMSGASTASDWRAWFKLCVQDDQASPAASSQGATGTAATRNPVAGAPKRN